MGGPGPVLRPGPRPGVAFSIPPIGIVRMRPGRPGNPPRSPVKGGRATLELFTAYAPGLKGLYEGLDLWVVTYHVPRNPGPESISPKDPERGVFATTGLDRPNPIEFLRAQVLEALPEQGILHVRGLEGEDGAAILDIRPASPPFLRLTRPAPGPERD